ncbi:MAG: ABC transporter permease [Oscillospiraceae bacterium]|jgi:simple sugar transport system permease protein|nr:ABC transporter permease [Oscillospiraceae bacterium]
MDNAADYIVSFIYAAVLAGTPLLFGTLGEILTERAGNLNLGVEGMMYMGAILGFWAGYVTGSAALALAAAFAAGALGALIYAFLTVTLKANQNVAGLTLTIFGAGFANFTGNALIMGSPTRTAVLAGSVIRAFQPLRVPLLADIPVLGRLLFAHNIFIYLGVAAALAMGLYLGHTRAGLNLRAVGENPAAADAAGVSVARYKYAHIVVGGGLCGLGGAYVSLVTCGGSWTYNCVNGLGWIAVALVIFASWSPYRAVYGSLIFGALSVLRLYIPGTLVRIPIALFAMVPFLATIGVLIATSIRMSKEHSQPKGCGVNYFREDR